MVEINLHPEKPSEAIIAAASGIATVKDDNGRLIGISKMNALDRMRLFEVVGSDNVSNEMYFGYASLAYHVISIDGLPVMRPTTKMQLEALIQRLDDVGLAAVAKGVSENFIAAKKSPDEAKESLKNG